MSTAIAQPRLRVAFAGAFAVRLEEPVRAHLSMPCDVILADEVGIVSRLPDVDVLVTMAFTREMGASGPTTQARASARRRPRSDRPLGIAGRAWLANVYGHETGIAEYVLGAMLTLTRGFARLDASLRRGHWESQWAVAHRRHRCGPSWPERRWASSATGASASAWPGAPAPSTWTICAIRRDVARSDEDELALLGGLEIVDEVLRRSDYLVISLPVTPETRGLIGDKQLHSMKPTAVLVNVSRAEIVDEEALYRALASGRSPGPPSTSGIAIRPPLDQRCPRASPSTSSPTSS